MIQGEVLDELLQPGKTIDLHVYKLIDVVLTDDLVYKGFNILIYRRHFAHHSFMFVRFK